MITIYPDSHPFRSSREGVVEKFKIAATVADDKTRLH